MKKEFKFYTNLGCACSEVLEYVTIDIPDGLSKEEENKYIDKIFNEWVLEKNYDAEWIEI